MFITVSKKQLIIFALTITMLTVTALSFFLNKTEYVDVPKDAKTIVIDAGHGGIDGGSVGRTTGIKESELTLAYTLNLKKRLETLGFNVVLTRKSEMGLYDNNASNKKRSDMQKRKQIIEESNASLIISIHMNSYALRSCKGAQVFYKKGNEDGREFAASIQNQFKNLLPNAKNTASVGDYFMVNCTNLPAVIVECGFLSNAEEERRLITKSYQDEVCYAIVCGVLDYLDKGEGAAQKVTLYKA